MLIIKGSTEQFNTNEIKRGTLIYAKHKSWPEAEKGFVVSANEEEVIVQYPPNIGNVTNHFFMFSSEVAAGDWEIRYSNDMIEIFSYPEGGTNESQAADL